MNGEMEDIIGGLKRAVESEKLAGIDELYVKNAGDGAELTVENLERKVSSCRQCTLERTRRTVVFGEGSSRADLMFIGEAPGADEDMQGRPFVGRAGQLLNRIIESIGLKREDVYIANILKCRPPGNRNPLPSEIASCLPHLIKQIEIIKPRVICAFGKFAAQTLLNTETPISRLRGRLHDYRGIKLMPTYHPAYLLRNPGGKREVWEDIKKIAGELGLEIPKRRRGKN